MKKMLRIVFQYSLLFVVLLFISAGIVRLFLACGLNYKEPSTVVFYCALFATFILMLISKIRNKTPKKKDM